MDISRHGIAIDIETCEEKFYLNFAVVGTLTHADYEDMMPVLESALARVAEPDVNALVDITELKGWELRAAWDDLKLGLSHGKVFKKIAILGEGRVQEWMTKVADWFTPGEAKFFDSRKEALAWLSD